MIRYAVFLVAIVAAILLFSQVTEPSFEKDIQPIINKNCTKCHNDKTHKANLDLRAEVAYKNLINIPSNEIPSMMRITPDKPENSYLYMKIEHKAEKGSGMPKGWFFAGWLSDSDRLLIKNWIEQGAKP